MTESTKAIEIFYSYAHEDEILRKALEKQLSNLKRQGLITDWHDRKIAAGTEWEEEIDVHLNTASIILLLVSSDFIASDYCCSTEVRRAMERHELGEARVIPIILRPTDWSGTLFEKLQVLPTDGKPVTDWRNRDKAFLDIVKGVRRIIEVSFNIEGKNGESSILCKKYCNILYERWKMLDFRGIMHADINRPIRMPLTEIFIFPDILAGIPEYETLERENDYIPGDDKTRYRREDEQLRLISQDRSYRKSKQDETQREQISTVLTKNQRLVILGDPGSGKSTLLRFLLLLLVTEKDRLSSIFSQVTELSTTVPLYIPIASYANFWNSSTQGKRSLQDFLSGYLHENYLGQFFSFLQAQLQCGSVLLLFDGLDEVPDVSLRMTIVRQIEMFTQTYPKNRFIVTSRIVGYREAPLAAEYRVYTLADFSKEQIKSFTDKWCPAYEHWVKEAENDEYLQKNAARESEKLFAATQHNLGVRRLAVNPLLLTILALIQRQGIELPTHRIELFELCATTLLDTWLKAKGTLETARFSKNDLIKILRPLSFWMHEHQAVGTIPEEELIEQLVKQLLERKVTRHEDDAIRLADLFLQTVRGKTGILIERGKHRYGFLHLTFEEYFAAKEIVVRKDRKDFVKKHLHDPRWHEVILLAIGYIGFHEGDEEGVTELVQDAILAAGSDFEQWLHYDLLFAANCLTDDVGVSIECEDEIIEQVVHLYLTSPYEAIRNTISNVFLSWKGTRLADKTINLVLPLLQQQQGMIEIKSQSSTDILLASNVSLEQKIILHCQNLINQWLEVQTKLLKLHIIIILSHASYDKTDWITYASNMLLSPDADVRIAAATALGSLGQGRLEVLDILLKALLDSNYRVRSVVIESLGHVGQGDTRVIEALLKRLQENYWRVRQVTARSLGQIGQNQPQVTDALLKVLSTYVLIIRVAVAQVLKQLGHEQSHLIEILIKSLPDFKTKRAILEAINNGEKSEQLVDLLLQTLAANTDSDIARTSICILEWLSQKDASRVIKVLIEPNFASKRRSREIVVDVLGRLSQGQPEVIEVLLQTLSDPSLEVRAATARALGLIGQWQSEVIEALFKTFFDSDPEVRRIAANTIGLIAQKEHEHELFNILFEALSDSSEKWNLVDLGQSELPEDTNPSTVLSKALTIALSKYKKELTNGLVARALRLLGSVSDNQPQVIEALLQTLSDPASSVRAGATQALGQIGQGQPQVIEALLELLSNPASSVRRAATQALEQIGQGQPQVIEALLQTLSDPASSVRAGVTHALGQIGQGQPQVIEALLQTLANSASSVRAGATQALGQIGQGQPQVIEALLELLSDPASSVGRVATQVLGRIGQGQPQVIEALLPLLSDPASSVRAGATQALGQIGQGQPQVIEALLPYLADSEFDVRAGAIQALGQIGQGQPQVIEALLPLLSDPASSVRAGATRALGQIGQGQPQVIEALLPYLADSEFDVRAGATRALGQIGQGQPQVIEALLPLLSDPASHVRARATLALGQIGQGQPQVIEALLELLSNPDIDVRVITESLIAMGTNHINIISHIIVLLKQYEENNKYQSKSEDSVNNDNGNDNDHDHANALLLALQKMVQE